MLAVKGKFDGHRLKLEHEVHVEGDVPVIVTFVGSMPAATPSADNLDFLLRGPTWSEAELRQTNEFIEEFRTWKV
jgi:hypothetical protein